MAYATLADVEAYMNRSLTSQAAQVGVYLDAATAWIDQQTGRTWSNASPATEKHTLGYRFIYLANRPVTGIVSVQARDLYPGAASTLLVAGSQYELLDGTRGLVVFEFGLALGGPYIGQWNYPYAGYMATIVYTHSGVVPANIRLAATIMASQKMTASLNSMSQRLRSFSDNRAVSVSFKDTEDITDEVRSLLPPKQAFIV